MCPQDNPDRVGTTLARHSGWVTVSATSQLITHGALAAAETDTTLGGPA